MKSKTNFKSALKFTRYQKFRNSTDRALEEILITFKKELTKLTRALFSQWEEAIIFRVTVSKDRIDLSALYSQLSNENEQAAYKIAILFRDLKRISYLLSMGAETEAIAQLKGEATVTAHNPLIHDIMTTPLLSPDSSHEARTKYLLDKLARKVMDSVHLGIIQRESISDLQYRIERVLPKYERIPFRPRVLSKVKEAGTPSDKSFKRQISSLFIDDTAWQDIVKSYKNEYIPKWREDPRSVFKSDTQDTERIQAWELEKEMTEEFVKTVRDGQLEAFKQNKVQDFVWIAIIDDKTDDCCLWRDGLLSSEIEKELDGKHSDDECDAIAPPAHINCRCRLAPYLDVKEEELPDNTQEFSEWLDQKEQL